MEKDQNHSTELKAAANGPKETSAEVKGIDKADVETSALQPEPEALPTPEEEIQQLKLQLDEYKDLFLRKAAEFENYKKRRQQEYASIISTASKALISELLPVLDDLDRLLANAAQKGADYENSQNLLQGAQLIRDKLMDLLTSRGLKTIECVGQPFDPKLHEALVQQQDSSAEPGIVLKEFARGYRLGDKIIRHAQVVVSG